MDNVDDLLEGEVRCKCGMKMYAYTDDVHTIFLCFKCGRFEGMSGGDNRFIRAVRKEPMLILEMIEQELLRPAW